MVLSRPAGLMPRLGLSLVLVAAVVLWSPATPGDRVAVRPIEVTTRLPEPGSPATTAPAVRPPDRPDGPDQPDRRPPELRSGYITRDRTDTYRLSLDGRSTVVRADEGNVAGDTRLVLWRADAAATRDHETCATWGPGQGDGRQQGAALRITQEGDRTRAITVTKNVAFLHYWVFNVHLMDSADRGEPYRSVGSFHLGKTLVPGGALSGAPWRLCARVSGSVLAFKVWPVDVNEPAWGDPAYGGLMQLPPGWDRPGRPGWYAGHLMPGAEVVFTDMTTTAAAVPAERPGGPGG